MALYAGGGNHLEYTIQLVFSTTRTWIQSFNCVHFQKKRPLLSLNHEQEPKVATTPVLQMCEICHLMAEGSPLFSSKQY